MSNRNCKEINPASSTTGRYNLSLRQRESEIERAKLVQALHRIYVDERMTLGELAEFTGFSPAFWSKAFTNLGLHAHPVTHRKITHKNSRRYALTHERAFAEIDTPEKAYWLGFLWADGHPTRSGLRIFVARRDGAHLESLREFLGSGAPITSVPISPIGGMPQQGLDVHSVALVKDARGIYPSFRG